MQWAFQIRGPAVELINGWGGTRGTEIIFTRWNTQMNVCECIHTQQSILFPDSRVMACNYFLNGRPCVYQNVNVCIITGSATPARMSRLSARQSSLKIEWQISMHCCQTKWQTEPLHSPWADKYQGNAWGGIVVSGSIANGWSFGHRRTRTWIWGALRCGAAGKENNKTQKEGRGGDVVDNKHRKHKNEYSTNQNGDSKYIHYGEEKTVKKAENKLSTHL